MFGLAVIESFVPRKAGRAFGTFLRLFRLVRETTRGVCDTNAFAGCRRGGSERCAGEIRGLKRGGGTHGTSERVSKGSSAEEACAGTNKAFLEAVKFWNSPCVSVCKKTCEIPTETFFNDVAGCPSRCA